MFLLCSSNRAGVPGVTQYNILPYSNYTYEWTAKQYGLAYYHSHAAATYADGLRGAIILHPKPTHRRPWEAISKDLNEQKSVEEAFQHAGSLVLHDWRHETMENALTRYRYTGQDPYCIDSMLINSQGRNYCYDLDWLKPQATLQAPYIDGLDTNGCIGAVFGFQNQMAKVNPAQCQNSTSALVAYKSSVHGSRDGKYAAFHILNAGSEFETCFSIDGHEMWVVAADGPFVHPQKVHILDTQLGQRYTVIVPLNEKGRYTIRTALCNNMPQIKSGYAVLDVDHKAQAHVKNDDLDHDDDTDEDDNDDDDDEAGREKRAGSKLQTYAEGDGLPDIRVGLIQPKVQPYIPSEKEKKLPLQKPKFSNGMKPYHGMEATNELGTKGKQWMLYNGTGIPDAKVSNYSTMLPWNKHVFPTESSHTFKFTLNITNGVSWALNTETLSGFTSQLEPLLWNQSPPQGAPFKHTILSVPVGAVVDIIHQAASTHLGNPAHPLHKHQNKVWVLGMGTGKFPYDSVHQAKAKQPGLLNVDNPPLRDSWHIPGGGWVVTRHKVHEAGFVVHHCHIVQHLAAGMMVVWQQGNATMPLHQVPHDAANFPHVPAQYIPMDGKVGLDI